MPYRRMDQEPEVEGHAGRYKFRDADGNEFEIPEDRIISVTTPDGDEVEGHTIKGRGLEQEPEAEGHGIKIKFTNDEGHEQEIEGHLYRKLDQEPEVEGHGYRATGR